MSGQAPVIIQHVFMYKKAYAGHKCDARPDLVPTLCSPLPGLRCVSAHDGILTLPPPRGTAAPSC